MDPDFLSKRNTFNHTITMPFTVLEGIHTLYPNDNNYKVEYPLRNGNNFNTNAVATSSSPGYTYDPNFMNTGVSIGNINIDGNTAAFTVQVLQQNRSQQRLSAQTIQSPTLRTTQSQESCVVF